MTLELFFQIYFSVLLVFHPIEENWNYNNPRPYPKKQYVLVNWNKGDFKMVDDKLQLMKKHMHDEPIKAKARRKNWEKERI